MRRPASFLLTWSLCCAMAGVCARAQQAGKGIVINVTQSRTAGSEAGGREGTYLNGYRATRSGQVMQYHSSHPDAETALIVRARRDVHSISWETDPLPDAASGDFHQFIWLAGIECAGWVQSKESHRWGFRINGEHWFTFRNAKDATAKKWKVAGRDGAELSFEATTVDKFGDLFGTMFLRVPRKAFPPGAPLVLEVVGEDAENPDWYMTFQHPFSFTPTLRAEPALLRQPAGAGQMLRISLDNLSPGRSVEIEIPNQETLRRPLGLGANIFVVSIPKVDAETELPVFFKLNGALVKQTSVKVKPVAQREIYLLSYAHNDIGYTDLQPNVERKHWRNIELALQLIRETRDYPPEARFKWNLEVLWALESYLEQASEQQRQEFLKAVREGSIGLNALYANLLTGLANSVEMTHFTEYARRWRAKYSLPITTALTSDIPGFTWGIVPALAQSGVKYFAMAPNAFDRIGYTLETWGDKPFYWISQSGQEKVLAWMAGASYSSFHEGELAKLGDEKILKLVRKLDETGYPYEIVQLPYTVGGDNGTPDPGIARFVREWNERYVTPRLILATHEQMFQEFEKRYGATLPTIQGDFTPYWEDGAASTARETALSREAVNRLIQSEALWSLLRPESYPEEEYYRAWRNVVLWDEHTWGAHNSVEEPDAASVKGQWKIKQQFALEADRMSRELLARALKPLAKAGRGEIAVNVFNTNSWPRTDLVLLGPEESSAGDRVVDAQGHAVVSQRLSTGELAFLAEDVPPLSAKRFVIRAGQADNRGSAKATANTLENSLIRVGVNERSGAIESLRWKKNGDELVDGTQGAGLNQYLYVSGRNPDNARGIANVRVRVKEQGKLVVALMVDAEAPGARRYSTEIRIVEGLPRVDITHLIDKEAVREKEGVHIAFPFNVPNGQVRYDVADGIVRPEADQLAGSCKNFFSVQSWVDISNEEYGVTWASVDAPLVEIGEITAEQPWKKSVQPSARIFAYVMNNYWHTNYKAEQGGPVSFRFSILPHGAFQPEEAARFGRERREPLMAVVAEASQKPAPSLMRITPGEVQVASIRPMAGGRSWLVYLYNPTSQPQSVRVQWSGMIPAVLRASDAFGRRGERVGSEFRMPAFGSAYLRVNRKPQ